MLFELYFEHNCDVPPVLFAGKTEGAECTSCWMPFVNAHARMMPPLLVHAWAALCNNNFLLKLKKEHKQEF